MSKKIMIAVFCILVLFVCYKWEQKVYKSHTYSHYQEMNEKKKEQKEEQKEDKGIKESKESNFLIYDVKSENETFRQDQIKKIAYLTFDDGPSMITKDVLQVLKQNQVKATFFLIGNQITDKTEPILKELVKNGNAIGIHTYSHNSKEIYHSVDAFIEDFEKTAKRIKEVTGVEPKIFRFPWGSNNNFLGKIGEEIIKELESRGYTYYDWNVSAEDSVGTPSEYSILHNVVKDYNRFNEPIILMHDSSINSLSAKMLPKIIEKIKKSGYEFDTLDNMTKPYQYPRD